jgi:predicted acetyltransferase
MPKKGDNRPLSQTSQDDLQLDSPRLDWLPSYAHALQAGWSPDNTKDVSAEQLAALKSDPTKFLASLMEQGGVITLPDGGTRAKLPFIRLWMWDGAFCGTISLRWQPGSDSLPSHVLGHVGYAVVPWKRGQGYASHALGVMLHKARDVGLRQVQITTDPDNIASRRVIEKNGGRLAGEIVNLDYGTDTRLLYLVSLENRE